jgi:hypothetical protein
VPKKNEDTEEHRGQQHDHGAVKHHSTDQAEINRHAGGQCPHAPQEQSSGHGDEPCRDLPGSDLRMVGRGSHHKRDRDSDQTEREQMQALLHQAELVV